MKIVKITQSTLLRGLLIMGRVSPITPPGTTSQHFLTSCIPLAKNEQWLVAWDSKLILGRQFIAGHHCCQFQQKSRKTSCIPSLSLTGTNLHMLQTSSSIKLIFLCFCNYWYWLTQLAQGYREKGHEEISALFVLLLSVLHSVFLWFRLNFDVNTCLQNV